MKRLVLSLLIFVLIGAILPAAEPGRKALVVGNGAYRAGPLSNPVHDASDVAEVLERAGFEVVLRVDRSLAQMEEDLRSFRRTIGKGDTALFYFAGHGVQVDGANFLLPVDNGNIRDGGQLRRRAIDAQEYVTAMADAGAGLNIVVLDACRDNPLPSASRSAERGLAVMSAPRTSETVIVFATKAGDVASDGGGRNSTFTGAFLETVTTPDLDLVNLFNEVGSKVRATTGGGQIPTIYTEPLSNPFYFFSSGRLAADARAESEKAREEVERLEGEIARLKAKINASRNEEEKRKLEIEEQRQAALLAAQKIRADNLAREAARREAEARAARTEAERLAAEADAAAARQSELERLASLRRSELDKLKSDAENKDDPDLLIANIERLEEVLLEVEAEYDKAWKDSEQEIRASFDKRLAVLEKAEPEGWESDDEFNKRIAGEKSTLKKEVDTLLTRREEEIKVESAAQMSSIRVRLEDAETVLSRKRWSLLPDEIYLQAGQYDRNEKIWPFRITSLNAAIPFPGVDMSIDLSRAENLKKEYEAMQLAIDSDSLVGTMEWKIERSLETLEAEGEKAEVWIYHVVPTTVGIKNLVTGEQVLSQDFGKRVASFVAGYRNRSDSLWARVRIDASEGNPAIYLDGTYRGQLPISILLLEGEYEVDARWSKVTGVEKTLAVQNGFQTLNMESPNIFVEGGSFFMGSNGEYDDEKPVHLVSLDSFYMMNTKVTFDQYDIFAKAGKRGLPRDNNWGRGDRPVIDVSWYDAVAYANWRSEQDGLTLAYKINGTNVSWDQSADGWRLPTEAEWEYAARGGGSAKKSEYAGSDNIDAVAWYDDNSGGKTHPVGKKQPNELGLYDMSGNVWEWCWDWYDDEYYGILPSKNPIGPASGRRRVLRGGSWINYASYSRVAFRYNRNPDNSHYHVGFRLVRPGSR